MACNKNFPISDFFLELIIELDSIWNRQKTGYIQVVDFLFPFAQLSEFEPIFVP